MQVDLSKYPRTRRLMQETGMTLDQVLIWTENEMKKLEGDEKHA